MEANLKKIQEILGKSDIKYDAIELAEAIWLSQYVSASKKTTAKKEKVAPKFEEKNSNKPIPQKQPPKETFTQEQKVKKIMIETEVDREASVNVSTQQTKKSGLPINIKQIKPDTLNQTALYNALKYFRQKKLSSTYFTLDIDKIVDIKADTNLFIPHYKQEYENRYNLIIMIDNSDTMQLWSEEIDHFIKSLKGFNLFQSVEEIQLNTTQKEPKFSKTLEIQNDTLLMVISDMTTKAWRSGALLKKLYSWQKKSSIFILQMFPSHLWSRTILNDAELVRFKSNRNRKFNQTLQSDVDDMLEFLDSDFKNRDLLKLPIATMELNSLEALSKVVTGQRKASISGAIIYVDKENEQAKEKLSDTQRVLRFYENSSKISHELAHYLSVVPLDINVMKIVQKLVVPESNKIHLAEILTSGLIKKEDELYQFYHNQKDIDGIREILLNQLGTLKYKHTIETLSNYVENNLDTGFSTLFQAILKDSDTTNTGVLNKLDTEFARINIKKLKRLGGKYEKIAQRLMVELEAIIPHSKRFQIGSEEYNNEKLIHKVVINYDFDMAKYPVTFEEYDLYCEDVKKRKPNDQGWGRGRRPVINVSWYEAKEYCEWLSKKTGENYRLPLEAEWEYICRAGTVSKWSFGNNETEIDKYAWYKKNSNDTTHKIGEKLPNPWGIYDMHGNVWEWCENDWVDSYDNIFNDSSKDKTKKENKKILRGGSINNDPSSCCSAYRIGGSPNAKYFFWGFRILRVLSSKIDNYNIVKTKENQIKKEIVPKGDITFKCKKCHTKHAIDCDELEWEVVESHEKGIEAELNYETYYKIDCDKCSNSMSLTFNCWEYSVGAENLRDVQGEGVEDIKGDCCLDFHEDLITDELNYDDSDFDDYIEYTYEQINEIKLWFFESFTTIDSLPITFGDVTSYTYEEIKKFILYKFNGKYDNEIIDKTINAIKERYGEIQWKIK